MHVSVVVSFILCNKTPASPSDAVSAAKNYMSATRGAMRSLLELDDIPELDLSPYQEIWNLSEVPLEGLRVSEHVA